MGDGDYAKALPIDPVGIERLFSREIMVRKELGHDYFRVDYAPGINALVMIDVQGNGAAQGLHQGTSIVRAPLECGPDLMVTRGHFGFGPLSKPFF